MTTKEAVVEIVKAHPCMTSKEIQGFVKRSYGMDISTQGVAAALRPFITQGRASKAPNSNGKTVYWFVKPAWEVDI